MKIDFENASFKDFENIPGLDPYAWADLWSEYVDYKTLNFCEVKNKLKNTIFWKINFRRSGC